MKNFLLFVILLFFQNILSAQIINISSDQVMTCDTNVFEATIINNTQSNLVNKNLIIDFDSRASFYSNSSFSIIGDSAIFSGININAGDSVNIEYSLYFPCSMIEVPINSGVIIPYVLTDSIFFNNISVFHNYTVGYTNLIANSNTTLNQSSHLGEGVFRFLNIYNTGTSSYSGGINFIDELNCGIVAIDSIRLKDEFNNILQIVYDTNKLFIDSINLIVGSSHYFRIEEFLTVNDCFDMCQANSASGNLIINWGCDTNQLCKSINNLNASITRDNT